MRALLCRLSSEAGYMLIGLLGLIVALAIAAAVAVQNIDPSLSESRRIETTLEMSRLSRAIAGEYALGASMSGSDFGYVGDVGALPTALVDLQTNPGSYSTWNGPYLHDRMVEAANDYSQDAWGTAYVYSGGVLIQSNGSGSAITLKLAKTSSDLLNCSFSGSVSGSDGSVPGASSINIIAVVNYPNGAGGISSDSAAIGPTGAFIFSGIPIGIHDVYAIDTISADTAMSFVVTLPRSNSANTFAGELRMGATVY